MKGFYSQFFDDDLWIIKETEWIKRFQGIRESQFTLGNGYLSTRGVLEEIPYDATPGTYIAGMYDKMVSQVDEIVNLPNAFNFKFSVGGEKLGIVAMDILRHKRFLNMKKGLLARHTVYQNTKKSRFDYKSVRFVSMDNKNIGVMQVSITPLDSSCEVTINTGIDTSISNAGVLTEGRKRHFRVKEVGQSQNAGYLAVQTLEKKHTVIYWSGFWYEIDGKKKKYAEDNIFKLKLKKNRTVTFTKVFHIKRYPYETNISAFKDESFKKFFRSFNTKFSTLLNKHVKAWEKLWDTADVVIGGAANLQQNLRFNIYHMLVCGPTDNGISSIGARTLSGEGYRGHIFWDTEIFLLPFYIFNFPEVARSLLLYRYRRLDKARELAKKEGYEGAKYAWESAGTGDETTPEWAKDIDGSIIRIYTHKFEHHITACVAYAFYKYYCVTGDERFMRDYGCETIFETARFWASRVQFNKRKKSYDIKNVIGPDEFHIDVNNNAFTNMMAKWNLIMAYRLFNKLKTAFPVMCKRLQDKINLKNKEVKEWHKIAPRIGVKIDKNGVIEQFDGYFKLKKILITETDENGMPIISKKLKTVDMEKTQFVKQADIVMLLYLLDIYYSRNTKKVNYEYYTKRTLHKSSLSAGVYSMMACDCGDMHKAYNFFNIALRMDISNLYGNTKEGIHAASIGVTWQAAVFGFGGISIKKDKLYIDPRMPRSWHGITLSLLWRGNTIKIKMTNEIITIKVISKSKKEIPLGIFNKITKIRSNKNYIFKRKKYFVAEGL